MTKFNKKISIILIIAFLIVSIQLPTMNVSAAVTLSSTAKARTSKAIVMYLDSPYALVNNVQKLMDSDNRQLKPVVVNQTTLVPLRFVSENLGAKVAWDQKTSTATLTLNSKTIKVTAGKMQMYVNSKAVALRTPADFYDGRTFVPLRSIVEAFGKQVFYNKNLVIISDKVNILDPVKEKTLLNEYITWFTKNMPILTAAEISKAYNNSVVAVYAYSNYNNMMAQGSGFYIGNGLFLTNYHVVEMGSEFEIETSTGQKLEVEGIVKYDDIKDLAIIKTKTTPSIRPVSIGAKVTAAVGDKIVAIGNPEGLNNTVSDGIVSGFRKSPESVDLIQITAPITFGSSGGPIIDSKGYVVGIATSAFEGSGNLNFAVSIDYVKSWVTQLTATEHKNISVLSNANVPDSAIQSSISKQAEAFNNENLNEFMSYVDKNGYDYDYLRKSLDQVFVKYDIEYTIKDLQILEKNFDSVVAKVTEVAKNTNDATYNDNEAVMYYIYKNIDGVWKQYYSETGKITTLKDNKTTVINGEGQIFDENGKLVYEGDIRDGVPNGNGIGYDTNGNIYHDGYWEDGEPVS